MIFGAGLRAELSNLSMITNSWLRLTLNATWPVTNNGEIINFVNEGGVDGAHQNSAGTVWPSSGLIAHINGAFNDSWTAANLPTGQNCGFRLSSAPAAVQGFTLFADEFGNNTIPVDVSTVEIFSSDNSTILHSFNLDSASSENVSDSEGSGELLLVGFDFTPSFNPAWVINANG